MANSLNSLGLFQRIDLVGAGRPGLPVQEAVAPGIRILRIGTRGAGASLARKVGQTAGWSASIFARYRNEKLACINCHSIATLPLGVALKRATGARIIYDAHELESEANGLRGLRKRLTKVVEQALIGQADHCIFVGDAIEQWYRREYGLANTTVLYNCPVRSDAGRSRLLRDRFGIADDTPVFLYQGVIGEGRGIRILMDAFSALGDKAALVVMGYGPLAQWFASQTARYHNIFYHPAVPPAELPAYTASADYGLSVIEPTSLSHEFCMPNKLFEYAMAGKPVIVSPTMEQRALVERYQIGAVAAACTAEAVRAAAVSLMGTPRERFLPAIERARDELCWEQQHRKLAATYLETLGFRPQAKNQPGMREVGA
ncbi:MAG TPA: glycosyltransferase [Noviherbaspirillum sp.]|uniref:glycosyltransferase n=1 Tax=Noviherbaspirillum sp. TaxID=1926288 RepID=UPI002F9286C2